MAKYRKKPVVVEAEQFFAEKIPWPSAVRPQSCEEGRGCCIDTLEGPLHVSDADWIITGVKGEKYPCKPDIFAATYERVEEVDEAE